MEAPRYASCPAYRHEFPAMTTRCQLQFHGVTPAQGDAIARAIVARVARLVEKYNFHAPVSWLNTAINGRRQNRVAVDGECAAILRRVRGHAERTRGAFDITTGTLAAELRRTQSLGEAAAVRARLAPWLGLARWWLEGDCLCFDNPHTRFDLGGVIKEYAVDEAARIAREHGVVSGLVNFGGDVATIGKKPDGSRFVAAVPHPFDPARLLFGLDLEDQALTTSGHYARHRRLQDGILSHIVVPGSPAGLGWASASVVSGSALLSGLYSTALLVRPDVPLPENTFAVVVDQGGKLHRLLPETSTQNSSQDSASEEHAI